MSATTSEARHAAHAPYSLEQGHLVLLVGRRFGVLHELGHVGRSRTSARGTGRRCACCLGTSCAGSRAGSSTCNEYVCKITLGELESWLLGFVVRWWTLEQTKVVIAGETLCHRWPLYLIWIQSPPSNDFREDVLLRVFGSCPPRPRADRKRKTIGSSIDSLKMSLKPPSGNPIFVYSSQPLALKL